MHSTFLVLERRGSLWFFFFKSYAICNFKIKKCVAALVQERPLFRKYFINSNFAAIIQERPLFESNRYWRGYGINRICSSKDFLFKSLITNCGKTGKWPNVKSTCHMSLVMAIILNYCQFHLFHEKNLMSCLLIYTLVNSM